MFRQQRFACVCLLVALAAGEADAADYDTIRFSTERSRPERFATSAMSPDGRYLALSFLSGSGARSGVALVDLIDRELMWHVKGSPSVALVFSADSSTVASVGRGGFDEYRVADGSRKRARSFSAAGGILGFKLEKKNGKLLVTSVEATKYPGLAGHVRVGDELLAVNDGPAPKHYDDRREWTRLVGKSVDAAVKALGGRPGTDLRLRLARRGEPEDVEVELKRQWHGKHVRRVPSSGFELGSFASGDVSVYMAAKPLEACAFVMRRDLELEGQHAIAPNGRLSGAVAQIKRDKRFAVEVHSLQTGELVADALLNPYNFRDARFSPDSKLFLVGTRDTVEILDVEANRWLEPVVLTPPEEADLGRGFNRRVPLGFGFPGDLYLTQREVVYARPAALRRFDCSRSRILAVGSEQGDLVLASLDTKQRVGLVGEKVLEGAPDLVQFSPNGDRLVAYANGLLYVFTLELVAPAPTETPNATTHIDP